MKRFISIILFIAISLSIITATAEGFTLRNGITFGDSMEDVKGKETIEIAEIDEELGEKDADKDYPYSITTKKDTVAGISGSIIKYRFDKDKKLREVKYEFASSTSKEVIDNNYESVNSGLVRKYGSPLGYSNGKSFIVTGSAIDGAVLGYELMKLMGGIGDMRDYDEWVVYLDDYNVKIEQVCYYYGSSYSDMHYSHDVSYTYFTDDMLKEEQDAKQERQDAVDSDI